MRRIQNLKSLFCFLGGANGLTYGKRKVYLLGCSKSTIWPKRKGKKPSRRGKIIMLSSLRSWIKRLKNCIHRLCLIPTHRRKFLNRVFGCQLDLNLILLQQLELLIVLRW